MAAKIDDPLLQQIEEAKKTDPRQEIAVIVTVTPGVDLTTLEQKGMKIQHRIENKPFVTGTLSAADVEEVAALDQVERIEADGTMHTLQE
jgi:chorismate mutase